MTYKDVWRWKSDTFFFSGVLNDCIVFQDCIDQLVILQVNLPSIGRTVLPYQIDYQMQMFAVTSALVFLPELSKKDPGCLGYNDWMKYYPFNLGIIINHEKDPN